MECPKCGAEIDKNTIVCPNCKKVLKIICPDCKTINTKNVCKKCGKVLVTKCAKCGKINLTKNKNCIKCGYSTENSVIENESNTEDFALLRIDFPNSDELKIKLGSLSMYQKFRSNLDNLIKQYVETLGIRRQIVNKDVYIIRFNKDYTMSASANSAIQATIEIINIIAKVNLKLLDKKNVALKCNFSIMKRNIEQDPYDIDMKYNVNIVSTGKQQLLKDIFQVITEESFCEYYQDNYTMETLDSALVDGEMRRFFQIDIQKFIDTSSFNDSKIEYEENSAVQDFIQKALINQDKVAKETLQDNYDLQKDDIYDIETIHFEEVNCDFAKTDSINVLNTVVERLQQCPNGILALKAKNIYQPYTLKLLSSADEIGIYQNIIPITCNDEMEYTPYSFFKNLIASVFDYTISQKLIDTNDFSVFKNINGKDLISDLIKLNKREMTDVETIRENYFQVFLSVLQAIPDTLIYIENFEKIDSGSKFALSQLFEHLEELSISYLITYDESYSAHKDMSFLLTRPYYSEITIKQTPDNVIINSDKEFYQNILTDFYFQRILKYACGSTLFLDYAIQYLLDSGVYQYSENSIIIKTPKTVMIPASLENLIKRRLQLLKTNKNIFNFLSILTLLGTRIDEKTIRAIDFPEWETIAEKLAEMGYIYSYNNCIYFSNYNLLKKGILEILTTEEYTEIFNLLLEKVYTEEIPNPTKAYLYDKSENGEKVIVEWENLANVSLSMGDISAYLNCSSKILETLDKYSSNWSSEDLELYKNSLFENVSNNLYEYDPKKNGKLAEKALLNLQKRNDSDIYTAFCLRIIQGSIEYSDYLYALNLSHGLLASMNNSSIDPSAENFDLKFLLISLLYVKILFSIGAYKEALDIGYNILNALDVPKLETINYTTISKEDFENLLSETFAYIALGVVITMREDVKDFLNTATKLLNFLPDSYSIFIELQNLLSGKDVTLSENMSKDNPICAVLFYIILAFIQQNDSAEDFARKIYKAKLIARDTMLFQFETFADLLIAYAYIKLDQYKKASTMIYEIIKTAKEKGMNSIVHIGWYIMSLLNIKKGEFDIAFGVLNNSNIQMEKSGGFSEYLTMLNKISMYKVLMHLNSKEQAQICLNQALNIIQKFGINLKFNIDNENIMLENSSTEEKSV